MKTTSPRFVRACSDPIVAGHLEVIRRAIESKRAARTAEDRKVDDLVIALEAVRLARARWVEVRGRVRKATLALERDLVLVKSA